MFFVEKSFFGTEKRYLCPFISGKGIFLEGGIGMRVRYLSLVFLWRDARDGYSKGYDLHTLNVFQA
jgi:hypothetical protein